MNELQWTPQLIASFWDGLGKSGIQEALGFAATAGPVATEFLLPWIDQGARCLDFGSGSGGLAQLLLETNVQLAAYEPSTVQAEAINRRLDKFPNFLGTVGTADRETFDFVICTEVIEHVLDTQIGAFMAALVDRVRPGGRVFLSTPHAENLNENLVYCPVCDHTFHRWQHQRSWRVNDFVALMERWGLGTEWVGLVGFAESAPVREFNLRRRLGDPWPWTTEPTPGNRFPLIGRGDHIVYVGVKRQHGAVPLREPEHASFHHASAGIGMASDGRGPGQGSGSRAIGPSPAGLPTDGAPEPADDKVLSMGVAEVRALGFNPIAVVANRTSVSADASTILRANELLLPASSETESTTTGRAALVYPGSKAALERAIAAGRLPDTSVALILEDGQWRRAWAARNRSGGIGNKPYSRRRSQILADHWRARILSLLGNSSSLRRVQPLFDRREAGVLETLLDPGDYPYRLNRIVEGRLLLATATLGSGGAERQLINTAEGLCARGVADVHILAEYLDSAAGQDFYLEKAMAVAASVTGSPDHQFSTTAWGLAHPKFREVLTDGMISRIFNIGTVIRELAPEVVHINLDWSNITVGIAAVLAGVPHVFVSGRNLSPVHFEFFQLFMYPCYRALSQCPGVHFLNNSEAGRLDYARWLRLDPKRIRVLRNGLQTSEFPVISDSMREAARKELGLPANARVVIGAFRLSSEKRPLLWIDAAAQIRRRMPDCHFLLCGVGPMQRETEARAARHGLTSHLRLLGSRTDIATVFSAADLVMHASLQEGTPNVLLEAQAMGVPVVTTPAFGAAEAVDDGVTGLVVRDETATSLARAAMSILRDARFVARVLQEGRRFVEARFSLERMVDDTLVAYADASIAWSAQFLPEELKNISTPLSGAYHERGQCWAFHLPQLAACADSEETPTQSTLIVLEDGLPLGPAHSNHEAIRSKGQGAFSHWGDWLYFSSSDGSNPVENGRHYVAVLTRGSIW